MTSPVRISAHPRGYFVTALSESETKLLAPAFPAPISAGAIRAALENPCGCRRLRELASGKRRVVCLVEDASRPAKTAVLIEALLEELAKSHPAPARVELVFAHGAHLGLAEASRREKLPPGLKIPIHHHDARADAIPIDRGVHGYPLYLNPVVAEADLRIGVSTVNFHPAAGFSGGAKLIHPGVANLESIMAHHALPPGRRAQADCPWRVGIERAAALAPLDFSLIMLVRPDGDLAGLWAGAAAPCEKAARQTLMRYAYLPRPEPAGFCLVGMKPYDRSLLGFFKAVDLCASLLAPGGIGVIAGACFEGKGVHLWRWDASVMRDTAKRLRAELAGKKIFLQAPGLTPKEIEDCLPEGISPLAEADAWTHLAAKAAGPKYHVPYGPLTAFAFP